MAKGDKSAKAVKTSTVCLGDNANFFHDAFTGITLAKGEKKELTGIQLRTKRIKAALSAGHLQYFTENLGGVDEEDLVKLVKKIKGLATSGKDAKKTADAFTMDALIAIAEDFDLEPEENDTKETLVEAIFAKVAEETK